MNNNNLEVIVIGAGHAGLSASYHLKQLGLDHIVFERGRIGESWRSQRWDTFVLNTPNNINMLPGQDAENDPHGFSTAKQFVSSLENYALKFHLPVAAHTEIIAIEKPTGSEYFSVVVLANGSVRKYKSRQVIICSGSQSEKKIPPFADRLAHGIEQLHAGEYRNAAQLKDGAVLVAGSAQSGCQIAEDLADAGKKVYLSTSMVGRVPRSYRGKDIMDWLLQTGFFEAQAADITDARLLNMRPPQLTGAGGGNRTISLQALAQKGIMILGKIENADDRNVNFQPNAAAHIRFADEFSRNVKGIIDEFILKNQLAAPGAEEDIPDMPDTDASCASTLTSLNLMEHNIRSIIWATGFTSKFNYIKLPVLNNDGNPEHHAGLTNVEGLYFLGLPWLRKRKSALIHGIREDAEFICKKVHAYSQRAVWPAHYINIL